MESVELATLQWMYWLNNIRLLEPIGYMPPAEAEANYWRQLDQKAETAHSTLTNQPLQFPGRFTQLQFLQSHATIKKSSSVPVLMAS